MTDRKGDWIQTYLGNTFHPMDPRADEIHIEDIAHSLSMQCRYAGHCRRFYSVAEHCVLIAGWLIDTGSAREVCAWGLMHDASEAYLVDVPRPVKPFLAGYAEAEKRVMWAVRERFQLPRVMDPKVKLADNRILTDERTALMAEPPVPWANEQRPLGVRIECWPPEVAEAKFLSMFQALVGKTPEALAAWRAERGEALAE